MTAEFHCQDSPLLAHSRVQAAVYTAIIELFDVGVPLIHKLFLTIEEILFIGTAETGELRPGTSNDHDWI